MINDMIHICVYICNSNYKGEFIGLVYTIGDWRLDSPTMAIYLLESQRIQ